MYANALAMMYIGSTCVRVYKNTGTSVQLVVWYIMSVIKTQYQCAYVFL